MKFGTVVEEQPNFVLLRAKESREYILYNRVDNTIRLGGTELGETGYPDSLDDLVEQLKEEPTEKKFSLSQKLIQKRLGKKWEQLILDVAWACTLACSYCKYRDGNYEEGRTHSTDFMTEETAMKALDMYVGKATRQPSISFYGGDALMNFNNVVKPIVEATEKKFKSGLKQFWYKDPIFHMTCNMMLVPQYAEFLTEHKFSILASIDGDQKITDRFRKTTSGEGAYDYIIRGIDALIEADPTAVDRLAFSVVLSSIGEIDEVRNFFDTKYPDSPLSIAAINPKDMINPELQPTSEQIDAYETKMREMAEEYIGNIKDGNKPSRFLKALFDQDLLKIYRSPIGKKQELSPEGICFPPTRRIMVYPNGDLGICEMMSGDLIIGNVDDGVDYSRAEQIVNDAIKTRNNTCTDCSLARMCTPCYVPMEDKGEISGDELAAQCSTLKSSTFDNIILYAELFRVAGKNQMDSYFGSFSS